MDYPLALLLLLILVGKTTPETTRRQNAFLNVTTTSSANSKDLQQRLLLFDSILYGFSSPKHTEYGQLVKALSFNTSSMQANNYGCTKYVNEILPEKYVAIVSRGECSFERKISVAFENKASALIVYNTENSAFIMFSNSNSINLKSCFEVYIFNLFYLC